MTRLTKGIIICFLLGITCLVSSAIILAPWGNGLFSNFLNNFCFRDDDSYYVGEYVETTQDISLEGIEEIQIICDLGSIYLEADPSLDEQNMLALSTNSPTAYQGGRVNWRAEKIGNTLQLRLISGHKRLLMGNHSSFYYRLALPQAYQGSLRANINIGHLEIKNAVFREAEIELDMGNLSLDYQTFEDYQLDARVSMGNLRLTLPRDASYSLYGQTTTGDVTTPFAFAVYSINGGFGRELYHGDGRGQIDLRVKMGNIDFMQR